MSEYKLTWITDDLAAGYAPMSYADLDSIRDQGIWAIVNLCGEYCDLHEIEEKSGFEVFYLPIVDECAPDMAALEKGLSWVDDALYQGKKVLIHCRFGIGRTGTFVTAFLIRRGLGLKMATAKLKKKKPQPATYRQWKMLKKYARVCGLSTIREPALEQKNVVDLTSYFQRYENLIDTVAAALDREHVHTTTRSMCGHDHDTCCYTYFELSLMEAVYLFHRMNRTLNHEHREAVVARAIGVQEQIRNLKETIPCEKGDTEPFRVTLKQAATESKIRCPLNVASKCLLYDHRPLRCRCDGIRDENLAELKVDETLDHLSRHLFWALSEQSPPGNGLYFSVAETVSGQFVQDYFNYLATL